MSTLGLEEKDRRPTTDTPLIRQVEKEVARYEQEKSASQAVVWSTVALAFFISLIFSGEFGVDFSISRAIGGTIGVLVIAGIPAFIAAKLKINWRPVFIAFAAFVLIAHVSMYFYEGRDKPAWQRDTKAPSRIR